MLNYLSFPSAWEEKDVAILLPTERAKVRVGIPCWREGMLVLELSWARLLARVWPPVKCDQDGIAEFVAKFLEK